MAASMAETYGQELYSERMQPAFVKHLMTMAGTTSVLFCQSSSAQ
jgi:hypothetical protein